MIVLGGRYAEWISAYFDCSHNRGKIVRVGGRQTVTGDIDLGRVGDVGYEGALINDVKKAAVTAQGQTARKATSEFSRGRGQRVHRTGQRMCGSIQIHQCNNIVCGRIANPDQAVLSA